ncbi:MAG: Nif3-like dinuclear metal center hexameric protein [Phycisphaerae bacterium]|nr:Nif3-like dinuclear metal center hexameric protein [Phycisphaerae bacterium]NUQ46158.1 Nif3-like dinuclear metal center hexameric protein [Phycisphaerae bacterium]
MAQAKQTHRVADLERWMDAIAPRRLAQSWDNVGLLAGRLDAPLRRCLLCIDLTRDVLDEAIRVRAEAVVSYHPPLFQPIRSLCERGDAQSGPGPAVVHRAIRHGIAIYSPHTALDAADGGTGDAIAALCDAEIVGPLEHATVPGSAAEIKLVTFVPADHVDRVADALSAAGAGRIGLYERCSFRIDGTGTFFGGEETDPVVGKKGRLETVAEVRLEMVCPTSRLPEAVAAMRRVHPYEEPAFDVYSLAGKPEAVGIGRLARLPRPMRLDRLAARLREASGAAYVQIVGRGGQMVRELAILVGSAGRLDEQFPRSRAADVVITGEIRHHDALAFAGRGWCAIALGHWASERPVLSALADALRRRMPGLEVRISRRDRDPFSLATR